jgi:HSP20 family protein
MFDQLATRWAFPDLRRQIDRVFEQVMEPGSSSTFGVRAFPALNVWEDNECVFVEAELPGVDMGDIEINVVGGELSIKGTRRQLTNGNGTPTFHRQERVVGEFSRFLTLPDAIDADKVEAVLKNGVLTIKLPKAEAAKPRRIQVQTR